MSQMLQLFTGNWFFDLGLSGLQMAIHNFLFDRYEVLTVVTVLWDGLLYGLVEVHRHFRGTIDLQ
jgi:hypothetical protein